MQKVVQSGVLSKPWQDLLDGLAGLPAKTMMECIAGKMALLRNQLAEAEYYKNMTDWDAFSAQLKGFDGMATADGLFRLEDFAKLNEDLMGAMSQWGCKGVRAAAVRLDGGIRVKAIVGNEHVFFDEPGEGFPTEELLTKLRMVAPE